jgi:kinetochor protein Mis14/NSL1
MLNETHNLVKDSKSEPEPDADMSGRAQYIHSTLTLALPSLSINGLDASPALLAPLAHATSTALASLAPSNPDAEPVYEPYDAALAERLRALYASLEAETMRVAELRREAPGRAVGVWVEQLGRPVEGPGGENESVAREEKVLLGPGFDGRGGEVERVFARAVGGLEALRGVTEGVARGERALRAAREVERI